MAKNSNGTELVKLSLQFFGEGNDDPEDDFEEEFFDDEDEYTDEEDADEEADDETDDEAEETEDGADADTADDAGDSAGGGNDGDADLISELRALGYVGNDLASLTKDMKTKREARAAQDAKSEGAAAKAAGKSHIRSGNPGKGANGAGTGGITEKQVSRFAANTGSSKEEARRVLSKHARLINGH